MRRFRANVAEAKYNIWKEQKRGVRADIQAFVKGQHMEEAARMIQQGGQQLNAANMKTYFKKSFQTGYTKSENTSVLSLFHNMPPALLTKT
eukprot:NODE_16290_length_397_cov_24.311111_g16267_i0.p2 GENE.NODE_16290_length_397_cov_24.311111_g16267_i0~~NODE_16290_length_397_cov_24.311111_g16267_i0.p2  ORF type:complete len:105 (+),score=44.07 NODE_16290_length_397_cov_24.311111_g16267_i0:44-316(+)